MLRIKRELNGRIKAQYPSNTSCETKAMLKHCFIMYGQYLERNKNYSAAEFAEVISKHSSLKHKKTKKCYDFLMEFNKSKIMC